MAAVCEAVNLPNVGIVYHQHHGHDSLRVGCCRSLFLTTADEDLRPAATEGHALP
jgi:hypothetical protein